MTVRNKQPKVNQKIWKIYTEFMTMYIFIHIFMGEISKIPPTYLTLAKVQHM